MNLIKEKFIFTEGANQRKFQFRRKVSIANKLGGLECWEGLFSYREKIRPVHQMTKNLFSLKVQIKGIFN